jgi:hypothetical protein
MCLAYQKQELFYLSGAILIAITEINYIKHCTDRNYIHTRIWAQTDAYERYERISRLCLQPHKRIHVLALTGIRVVTQDFGRKSKLKF